MSFKDVFRSLLCLLPLRNIIIFESLPPFGCNTYPVYKLMESRGILKKYKPVWLIDEYDRNRHGVGESALCLKRRSENWVIRILEQYMKSTARCLVSCNTAIKKRRPGQLAIFLAHGSKIKKTRGIYEIGDKVDFALCQSEFFEDVMSYEYDIPKDRLITLGYPRCDMLFSHTGAVNKLLPGLNGEKVIAWLPTWRQYKKNSSGVTPGHGTGIPLIETQEDIKKLNDALTQTGIHIVMKPHHAQDLSFLRASPMDHFHLIDDSALADIEVQLYELLAETDALITDYSSVIFDYLLCDKPIGLTLDDFETYDQERGFAYDVTEIFEAGEKLPDMDCLKEFIKRVSRGEDARRNERRRVRDLTNRYQDGGATKRVVDFIEKELAKRGEKKTKL